MRAFKCDRCRKFVELVGIEDELVAVGFSLRAEEEPYHWLDLCMSCNKGFWEWFEAGEPPTDVTVRVGLKVVSEVE